MGELSARHLDRRTFARGDPLRQRGGILRPAGAQFQSICFRAGRSLDQIVSLIPLALPSIAEYVLDHAANWGSNVCALRFAKATGTRIEIMLWPVHEVAGESWRTGLREPVLLGKAGALQTAGVEGASSSQTHS
jgi:hypothetical protein